MPLKMNDKSNKIYIVTGCHLSATSMIANALHKYGILMGTRFRKWTGSDRNITNLNDSILQMSGGDWNHPPPQEEIDALDVAAKIKNALKKFKNHKIWGVKDPRFALVGKHYLEHLKGDVYLFCCFRRPSILFKSSKKEADKIGGEGLMTRECIDRYNQSTIDLIKEFCELKEGE